MSFLPNRDLVLVVDDDRGILRARKRLLRQHGYDTLLFPSAEAFRSHNDFEKAVCIILDINLNDGSGIELRIVSKRLGFPSRLSTLPQTTTLPFAWRRSNPDASPISQSRSRRSR